MRCSLTLLSTGVAVVSLTAAVQAQTPVIYAPGSSTTQSATMNAPMLSYTTADSPAPTASFYFARADDPTGTPILNYTNTSNQPINLAVWYSTSLPHNNVNVLVGYDRSTNSSADTDNVTPQDSAVVLNGTADSAVSNINSNFVDFGNAEGGGAGLPDSERPYGDDVGLLTPLDTADVTADAPTHLFDISLSTGPNYTGSYDVTIYSFSSGANYTTFVYDGSTYVRPPTYTLHITDAPEPPGWLALLMGALGLSVLARRRMLAPPKTGEG